MNWYCKSAADHPIHGPYHDSEYGFPGKDDRALFELLCLEIFQAGLSWELVLKKRPGMVAAFDGFDIDTVAAYGEQDVERLLNDAGIIRNRLKITSIIHNAGVVQGLRATHDGFANWLAAHHPQDLGAWVKLFKKTFKFTGPEVVNEFLMSTGYLDGAHAEDCPVYRAVLNRNPPWLQAKSSD
ncbi:DNA-3-methyladenine glycosylase I [Magnetovibrio sp.]|uniref:DNA-3-methyladenine glycosylase I n=1 Tax=Magnetovibrio sp. TaxID=2024836 RepID=UPI002F9225CF